MFAMKSMLRIVLTGLAGGALIPAVATAEDKHEVELKLHGVYWIDEGRGYPSAAAPNPKTVSYEQGALGAEVNYRSPFWGGVVGFDASGYGVLRVADSGTPTTQMLEVGNNGQLQDGYLALGQALVKLKWNEIGLVKVGRQLHDSLLLKSTYNRAAPDTYSGVSGVLTPVSGLRLYGAAYDQWRPRSTGDFEKFRTEAGRNNAIDYVAIGGASYANGPFAVRAEYLNSKDYLAKYGMVASYTLPIRSTSLKLSSGIFTSRDAGSRFVCGAESDMDCSGTGRISNKGTGYYFDADWKVSEFKFGAAVAKFDGFWVEDNFAVNAEKTGALTQDHGTNPFPTSATVGPDFTNNDETVVSARLGYDWKRYLPGLTTAVKYIQGSGAHPSNLSNGAEGKESYREFMASYAVPWVKNLSLRYIYLNYDSSVSGGPVNARVKGLTRQDWEQHRFYIDYVYQF